MYTSCSAGCVHSDSIFLLKMSACNCVLHCIESIDQIFNKILVARLIKCAYDTQSSKSIIQPWVKNIRYSEKIVKL